MSEYLPVFSCFLLTKSNISDALSAKDSAAPPATMTSLTTSPLNPSLSAQPHSDLRCLNRLVSGILVQMPVTRLQTKESFVTPSPKARNKWVSLMRTRQCSLEGLGRSGPMFYFNIFGQKYCSTLLLIKIFRPFRIMSSN